MDCPKCVGILQEVKMGKKEPLIVYRCSACGGMWFDKDKLCEVVSKEILDTVKFELEEEPIEDYTLLKEVDLDRKKATCPRCSGAKKMVKIPSPRNSKVTIDYCDNCEGIWLDAGEFDKISKPTLVEATLEHIINFFRLHFPGMLKEDR